MPEYVIGRVENILQQRGAELQKSRILIAGVTYKKDIKDLRKSPSLDIIEGLMARQVPVSYYDSLIPYLKINHINLESIALSKRMLGSFDCVIVATDHSMVDYSFILKHSKLIFDTRNVYQGYGDKKIHRL